MRNAENRAEKLDRILRVLGDLSDSATKLKNLFKERMIACSSQYGFAKLPNEIVVKILKITLDSWLLTRQRYQQSNEQLETLSLVCRRFRDIINSHAHFWTKFGNAWNPVAIAIALERSKGLSLELSLYSEADWYHPITKFLTHTMHLRFERVRSIHIEFADYEGLPAEDWNTIFDALGILRSANLPALEHFYMGVPTFTNYYPRARSPVKDDFCIYRTWNAPSLQSLSIEGLIPIPHESLDLRQLVLCFGRLDKYLITNGQLSELLDFLSSQPRLQRLTLLPGAMDAEEADMRRNATIHLPELTSLSLGSSKPESYPVIILSALSTPALESVDIRTNLEGSDASLDTIFHGTYPSMKKLRLLVWGLDISPLAPFKTIFAKFPKLEFLQFSTPDPVDGELPTLLPSVVPPPLRAMELTFCKGLGVEELKQVLEFLKQGPHWDVFERLVIEKCGRIKSHIEELYSLVPASKVTLRRKAPWQR
jgi:hypothetical protein